MATLTTSISNVSISVSGNTTKTATISWTCPTVPAGSTITSCTLTGNASSFTTGNKGATLTINNTSVSSGSSFTINLGTGNNTTSVQASFKGNHKQSNTSVTLSNLVYTVEYTEPLPTYTVTFNDWDGSVLKTEEVESGSAATAPSNPSREGYEFIGWDKTFGNITSDLTITAQYSIKTYTVKFYSDSTLLKTETVEHGKSATAPNSPVKEGHTFIGWDKDFTNITSDLSVYALYKINKYTVTFVDYDGTTLKTEEVEYGNSATAPSNPVRSGYKFVGWDKEFVNVVSDLIITAQYVPSYYTVTFLDYNKTILKIEEVLEGGSATPPEVNREDYIFWGWSVDFSNVTSNIVTIAQYRPLIFLNIKENESWTYVDKIYKKIDGNWIEQSNTDLNAIFDTNTKYKNEKPNPVAILYSDGTFIFQDSDVADFNHGDIVNNYVGWDTNLYNIVKDDLPWYDSSAGIANVIVNTIVSPNYMKNWFNSCYSLISIDLSNFDTSNVVDMSFLFQNCNSLTSLDLSSFNTSNVTNMNNMFGYCSWLTSLDLSSFDTSNVTDMHYMFFDCTSLTSLDLSNFDMTNVTNTGWMFGNCTSLQTIYVKDKTAKTKIEASEGFPTGVSVIIGKPN